LETICYQKTPLTLPSLVALYQMAHFCVVSSLHDGMNVVAKEFVAARDDETGVLVLSALAGAAQELKEALVINPYDIRGFAQAILTAIEMSEAEQRVRMRALRRTVAGRSVFVWARTSLKVWKASGANRYTTRSDNSRKQPCDGTVSSSRRIEARSLRVCRVV
jgi:trehalose-6-phosphate synthase